MKEALFYTVEDKGKVQCQLCNHRCHIKPGRRGICRVRENRDGKLYSLVYGKVISANSDPIEKKPLFHFLPGSTSYSIATVGCNFRCLHCQNWQISQYPRIHEGEIAGEDREPEDIVNAAVLDGAKSISYTYVEPTIFYELAYDCAVLAKKRGLRNVFVSNGYMTPEVTRHLA
ncbi:MAG: radical SAM protein, partial [Deltaproteobacteria bacterium]|nr:radical SAM protein [Deltaproteobacteria bacterium]